jgi:mycothiol system anti-sigma-R factor
VTPAGPQRPHETGRNTADHALYRHVPGDEDCNEAIRELYTFLDGELTVDKRAAISAHLDDCHPCLEAFDFEAVLRIVVADHCREQVPDRLKDRIASLIAEDAGGPPEPA